MGLHGFGMGKQKEKIIFGAENIRRENITAKMHAERMVVALQDIRYILGL